MSLWLGIGTKKSNSQKASAQEVCEQVHMAVGGISFNIQITNDDGTIRNQEWIDEAKRTWGEDMAQNATTF